MKRTLLAASACLFLVTGLAHGQKSLPYDPSTGVYTLDYDDAPKSNKDKAAGKPSTQSETGQTRWQQVYPPGYWEKQEELQRKEVAEYERKYQQRIAAEEAARAKREAEERSRQAAEDKANRLASEQDSERRRKRNVSEDSDRSHSSVNRASHGAVNPVTGEFYAPAGAGNLVGTRDGTLFTPAGPNGYINTRTGQFVPAH